MEGNSVPKREPYPFRFRNERLDAEELNFYQKRWITKEVIHHGKTVAEIAAKHGLKPDTIRKWVRKERSGKAFYPKRGRPGSFDDEELENLKAAFNPDKKYQVREDESLELYQKAKDATAKIRNKLAKSVNSSDIRRVDIKLNIRKANAETTTDARAAACADLMNFVTFAAMNWLFVVKYQVHVSLILNMDATQFMVGNNKDGKVRVKYIGPVLKTTKAIPHKNAGMR